MARREGTAGGRIAVLASAALVLGVGTAEAQMTAPAAGARYTFECAINEGPAYQEVHTVTASADGQVRIEVSDGVRTNWYVKPLAFVGTTLISAESVGGHERSLEPTSAFDRLAALEVGDTIVEYVTERRGAERLRWKYKVLVVGRETTYLREVGDLPVYAILEGRWTGLYSSEMQSYYSPDLAFAVLWDYGDSNGAKQRCALISAENLAPVRVAAAAAPAEAPSEPEPEPEPEQVAAVASEPAAPAEPKAAEPSATAEAGGEGALPVTAKERLAQLDELLKLALITPEEHAVKRQEIFGERAVGGIAAELEAANCDYRRKTLTPEAFVARRAEILAKINATDMDPRQALVLLNQLHEKRLISQTEYARKRKAMLAAL